MRICIGKQCAKGIAVPDVQPLDCVVVLALPHPLDELAVARKTEKKDRRQFSSTDGNGRWLNRHLRLGVSISSGHFGTRDAPAYSDPSRQRNHSCSRSRTIRTRAATSILGPTMTRRPFAVSTGRFDAARRSPLEDYIESHLSKARGQRPGLARAGPTTTLSTSLSPTMVGDDLAPMRHGHSVKDHASPSRATLAGRANEN